VGCGGGGPLSGWKEKLLKNVECPSRSLHRTRGGEGRTREQKNFNTQPVN